MVSGLLLTMDVNYSTAEKRTISNSSSRSSYSTFSSTSSNPPAKAPHLSVLGQCHRSIFPAFVVDAIAVADGCH